eukprot:PhF_6_TR12861/c0_g1_i2/m.20203
MIPHLPKATDSQQRKKIFPSTAIKDTSILRSIQGCGAPHRPPEGFGSFKLTLSSLSTPLSQFTTRRNSQPKQLPEGYQQEENHNEGAAAHHNPCSEPRCNVCSFVRFELAQFEHRLAEHCVLSLRPPESSNDDTTTMNNALSTTTVVSSCTATPRAPRRQFYLAPQTSRPQASTAETSPIIAILFRLDQIRTHRIYQTLRQHFTLADLKNEFYRYADAHGAMRVSHYHRFLSAVYRSCPGTYTLEKKHTADLFMKYSYGVGTIALQLDWGTFAAFWEMWYGFDKPTTAQLHFSRCYKDLNQHCAHNMKVTMFELRAIVDAFESIAGSIPTIRENMIQWGLTSGSKDSVDVRGCPKGTLLHTYLTCGAWTQRIEDIMNGGKTLKSKRSNTTTSTAQGLNAFVFETDPTPSS